MCLRGCRCGALPLEGVLRGAVELATGGGDCAGSARRQVLAALGLSNAVALTRQMHVRAASAPCCPACMPAVGTHCLHHTSCASARRGRPLPYALTPCTGEHSSRDTQTGRQPGAERPGAAGGARRSATR